MRQMFDINTVKNCRWNKNWGCWKMVKCVFMCVCTLSNKWWWCRIQLNSQLYPGCLGGTIHIFGHCHNGNDKKDDGGRHTSHEILWEKRKKRFCLEEKQTLDDSFITYTNMYNCEVSNLTIRGQRKPLNLSLNLVEYANSKKRAARNSSRGTVTKAAAVDAAKHTNDTKDRAYKNS